MDWCHIIINRDGFVVAEFNRDAPRIAALGEYFLFKSAGIIPTAIGFLPLFQRSVLDELDEFKTITVLEIEALTTEADAISQGEPNLGAAFGACGRAGQVNKAEIILKTNQVANADLKSVARRLFQNPFSRESLTRLKAHGSRNGSRKPLDLLQQYLVTVEDFVKLDERSKAVDSAHAFEVLNRVYLEYRDALPEAVSIEVSR